MKLSIDILLGIAFYKTHFSIYELFLHLFSDHSSSYQMISWTVDSNSQTHDCSLPILTAWWSHLSAWLIARCSSDSSLGSPNAFQNWCSDFKNMNTFLFSPFFLSKQTCKVQSLDNTYREGNTLLMSVCRVPPTPPIILSFPQGT